MSLSKRRILSLAILAVYLLSPVTSWACTSIIVGKNASTTGRVLFARTEDLNPNNPKKFIVVPAGFFKKDINYALQSNGFNFKFSHDSYKYTAVAHTTRNGTGVGGLGSEATSKDLGVSAAAPGSLLYGLTPPPLYEDGYYFTFDGSGVNEKGLAVSATTTNNFRNVAPDKLGSYTHGNSRWTEHTMAKVLLAEAANCQEAMDVIDRILNTQAVDGTYHGSSSEIIKVADQNEAWVIEFITRRNYIASRVPDDCFMVFANAMTHKFFNKADTANFRSNFDPEQYATSHDVARFEFDENGVKRINIALTFGGTPSATGGSQHSRYNAYRFWGGISMFKPSLGLQALTEAEYYGGGGTNLTSGDTGRTYPNYLKPDKKISPMDIAMMQRYRYAGTPIDVEFYPQYIHPTTGAELREGHGDDFSFWGLGTGPIAMRSIGYVTAGHTHIFDVGGNLPPEIGARFWVGLSAAETSVNIPFYGNITDTHPKYKYNQTHPDSSSPGYYDSNSAYWLFSDTGRMARSDRRNYAAPLRAFWRAHELSLYEDQEKVIEPELLRLYAEDPAIAAKFITDYTIAVSDRTLRAAEKIHDALKTHIANAPGTLFVIPADLVGPTINNSAFRSPTDDDKTAVGNAQGSGHSLLTRDDGNIQVNSVGASAAPDVSGFKFDLPGAEVEITLKPEQITAKQTAAKMLYEVKLDNALINAFGGLGNLKKNLTFIMSADGKTLNIVGPSGAMITFEEALAKGITTLTLTSDGAIVTIEYILADGPGNSGVHNNVLVICDGDDDGVLSASIWVATPTSKIILPGSGGGGCDWGLGYVALGLFGMLIFARKNRD
ncbi:MAG: C69 family dipeptidase [Synergistaceae bacterium]|nr:C69 family dipeptidase [Synergistaceae bacterium]